MARFDDMILAGVGYGPVSYAVVKGSDEFPRTGRHPPRLPMYLRQASESLVVGSSGLMITSLGMNLSRMRRAPAGERKFLKMGQTHCEVERRLEAPDVRDSRSSGA